MKWVRIVPQVQEDEMGGIVSQVQGDEMGGIVSQVQGDEMGWDSLTGSGR